MDNRIEKLVDQLRKAASSSDEYDNDVDELLYVAAHMLENEFKKHNVAAYAVRNNQGYWVGIWNDESTAKHVISKQPGGKDELVPIYYREKINGE